MPEPCDETCDIIGCFTPPTWTLPADKSLGTPRFLCEIHLQELVRRQPNVALQYAPFEPRPAEREGEASGTGRAEAGAPRR